MTTETFTTAGQNIWTCPAGVSTVQVELWGGGAGGGGNAVASDGGGGGSGGGYGRLDAYTVTAGGLYTYNVGTQGVGVTAAAGTAGGVTWWRSAADFQVPGGTAGKAVAAGSPGGVATADTAFTGSFTVTRVGGNGGAGVNNNNGGGGGGGGSSGDTTSAGAGGTGTAGTGGAGGAAGTTNGGIGGVGGSGTADGATPISGNGGGGGGSGEGNVKGGDGTVGKLVLIYTATAGMAPRMHHYKTMGAA